MKFAGPSMGAALGSGFMQGMDSTRNMLAKEELARDASAMATYSKLVQSGDWEPVGKEGAKDGGVLRVGNVGFLKRTPRQENGIDLKAANLMSQIQSRTANTGLQREKFEFSKTKPTGMVTVGNPQTGERKLVHKDELTPTGFFKIGTVNAPIMQAQARRVQSGRELSVAERRLSAAEKIINKNGKLVSILRNAPEGRTPFGKATISKYDKAVAEKESAEQEIQGLLGKTRTPFISNTTKDLPTSPLSKDKEADLRSRHFSETVDKYLKIYDKVQEGISNGTYTEEQVLDSLDRLIGERQVEESKVRVPISRR